MNGFYLIILVLPFVLGVYRSYINLSFNDKNLFFGVRLPIDFNLTKELEDIKKSYKKNTIFSLGTVFVVASILFFLVPENFSLTVGIVGVFLYPIVGIVNFAICNSKVANIKKRDKWSGYSKNIVVVDLDYRNSSKSEKSMSSKLLLIPVIITFITLIIGVYLYITTKNQMVPGVFGENGIVESYVKRGEVVSIFSYLMPVIIQIIINISVYFSYYMVLKSKQIVNGGEVENLKIYNKKVKAATIYYTVLIATVIDIFLMGAFIWDKSNNFVAIVGLIVVSIISIVIYSMYYQRVIKEFKVNYSVKDGKMLINRDDDKSYIFGMFYNNPNDPSFFIPKRIGTGYDWNYGNLKVRIIYSLGAILISTVIVFTAFILPFSVNDKVPELTNDYIKITGLYGSSINKEDIVEVSLVKKLPENLYRSNGIGGFGNKLLGNFVVDNTYKAKLYIENSKEEVIKILKRDGSLVYINHGEKESTEKLYNMLKIYIEKN